MIRFATPSIAEDIRDDKVLTFDRSRYGMIAPAAGVVYSDHAAIEASLKAWVAEPANAK